MCVEVMSRRSWRIFETRCNLRIVRACVDTNPLIAVVILDVLPVVRVQTVRQHERRHPRLTISTTLRHQTGYLATHVHVVAAAAAVRASLVATC